MKILLTGFSPFGGEAINPSYEAIKNIPKTISGEEIICLELPTVFKQSINDLVKTIDEIAPDVVLCIGQAGGRFDITLERIAINVDDARIPDNVGNQPIDETIFSDGSAAYFTNLPIKTMVAAMRSKNIPASISNSAGTFVCNHIMYGLLYHINKHSLNIKGGFMHVPYINEQIVSKGNTPFMSLEMIREGIICSIETVIRVIKENSYDIKTVEGKLD